MQEPHASAASDRLMGMARQLAHLIAAFVATMVCVLALAAIIGIFGLRVAAASLVLFIASALAIVWLTKTGSSHSADANGNSSHE